MNNRVSRVIESCPSVLCGVHSRIVSRTWWFLEQEPGEGFRLSRRSRSVGDRYTSPSSDALGDNSE